MAPVDIAGPIEKDGQLAKKPVSFVNLAVGAGKLFFQKKIDQKIIFLKK
jgi:hypothetical protein